MRPPLPRNFLSRQACFEHVESAGQNGGVLGSSSGHRRARSGRCRYLEECVRAAGHGQSGGVAGSSRRAR